MHALQVDVWLIVASDQKPAAHAAQVASFVALHGATKEPGEHMRVDAIEQALQDAVWLIVASDQKPAAHAAQVASAVAVQAVVDVPAEHTEQATQSTPPFVL